MSKEEPQNETTNSTEDMRENGTSGDDMKIDSNTKDSSTEVASVVKLNQFLIPSEEDSNSNTDDNESTTALGDEDNYIDGTNLVNEDQNLDSDTEKKSEDTDDDEESYYEPIDYEKEGVYVVKEYDQYTAKCRWKIDNVKEVGKKEYSPLFTIAGEPWRILIFPHGNDCPSVSMYLDVADAKTLEPNWAKFSQFQLTILNHKNIKKSISQEAEKRFSGQESDWGFREFMPTKQINEKDGFITPEGCLIIECVIHINKDTFVVHPNLYNSKKETGFVGLKNQGATCYINSLLQTWFHITYLRKKVYEMPIPENEIPTSSIPLALQRVFYNLQYEDDAVDTKELTKSFGWDTMDSFMQHDVQEFARVLTENLEKKMDKTLAKGTMKKLFEGINTNYIECINVDFQSKRDETFYDLQLNVKGCRDVYESLNQYVEIETLEGENQYRAEGHGLQDAKRGCIFKNLPPVLQLHLKRFEYDYQRDIMYKINEKYEFPEEINLTKYLSDGSDQKNLDNTYVLFSVLVHSGGVNGGHYYAFINIQPYDCKDDVDTEKEEKYQWFKFDDEKVYKVKKKDAVEENFGGNEAKKSKYFWLQSSNAIYKKFTNAYMLVYIRKSELKDVLKPVKDDEVPKHLGERLQKEKAERERKRKEKEEAHKYVLLTVATEKEHLSHHRESDLANFDDIAQRKISKQMKLGELKKSFEEEYSIPANQQRIWKMDMRQNKTLRPGNPIYGDEKTIGEILGLSKNRQQSVQLYVEHVNPEVYPKELIEDTDPVNLDASKELQKEHLILSFKFYDPSQTLLKGGVSTNIIG